MKSGFWQIQIHEKDKYKTAFVTPFGQYEWNVMPFGLKNAQSEFQNIMNDILSPLSMYSIVYIDDVLIFSKFIEEYWKHLNSFLEIIKINGFVVSATKIKLFQTNIRFLGYINIYIYCFKNMYLPVNCIWSAGDGSKGHLYWEIIFFFSPI